MRLIDADALKYDLLADNYDAKMTPQEVADCIDYQPTAYDVEKVVEQLEERRKRRTGVLRFILGEAIEVVRKGGVK